MIHTLFDEGYGGVCLFLSVIYEGFQKKVVLPNHQHPSFDFRTFHYEPIVGYHGTTILGNFKK